MSDARRQGGSNHAPERLPEHLRYMAVEGAIGVGKSALARLLAQRYNARLVLENLDENPFLELFYRDPSRWGFQTQVAFLASRFRQQKAMMTLDLFHQGIVSDYSFFKDRIFAHLNLSGDDVRLYESLYTLMEPNTPRPDLVIYLQSSIERSLHNIRLRGHSFELDIDRAYIAALHEAYNFYFFRYTKTPLLIINVETIDFVNNPEDWGELAHQISKTPLHGTTYFNPTPSSVYP